jgi:putative transposase
MINNYLDYHQPLVCDKVYHLFSRAVGNEVVFKTDENYRYFLSKLKFHTSSVCDLFCYSLLPNHFHLLVQIKNEDEVIKVFEKIKKQKFVTTQHNISEFIMERFSNWLNGYTKAFNKMYDRKGSLFMDYLKRVEAASDSDLTNFIWYIHKNAVHHGLVKNIGDWKYDNYYSHLSNALTSLLRSTVIEWFGSKEAYIKFHQQPIVLKLKMDEP